VPREISRTDPFQFTLNYQCGCSFVAWKSRRQNAETYGWHLCPDHISGFQAFRQTKRREFRIKHPCHCYYVVWGDARRDAETFGWRFCPDHGAEYEAFKKS
jgi:elongation factor P hydroxylase